MPDEVKEYRKEHPEYSKYSEEWVQWEIMKETDPIKLRKYTEEIAHEMIEAKSKYVPIYDIYGNLQWPKQMKYEAVKKFVAERDKNKEAKVDQSLNVKDGL